jgi:hypothetical protein
MIARTFEAVTYHHAVRRAREMGLIGDIVLVAPQVWICVAA